MKLDISFVHLTVFLATLTAVVLFVLTGHETPRIFDQLLGGAIGAVLGVTSAGATPLIKGLTGSTNKESGFVNFKVACLIFAWCIMGCIALSACAGLKAGASPHPVAESCVTASAAIKVLAVAKTAGKLSESQIATVDASLPAVEAACETPVEPSLPQATAAALASTATTLSTLAAPYRNAAPVQ